MKIQKADHYSQNFCAWMDRLALAIFITTVGIMVVAQGGLMKPTEASSPPAQSRLDSSSLKAVAFEAPQSFDHYAAIFEQRDIFKTDEDRILEATAVDQLPLQMPVYWANNYELKAVIVDEDPQAVVAIKNPPEVKFLKVGDYLQEAVLKRIGTDSVWFFYKGQEVELKFKEAGAQ